MAIEIDDELVLLETTPVAHVPANISINHLQLRNLILSPDETASPTLFMTHRKSILQHKITKPDIERHELGADGSPGPTVSVTEIAKLPFDPVCLSFARIPTPSGVHQHTLLAAGGQSAELHISLHTANFEHRLWEYHLLIKKASINNSVLVLPPSPQPKGFTTRTTPKPLTMRVLVSNNDRTVKFYEVDIGRLGTGVTGSGAGSIKRGDVHEMGRSDPQSPRSIRRRDSDISYSPHSSRLSSSSPLHEVFSGSPSAADVGELVRRYAEIKLDNAVNFTTATRDMSTLLSITDSQTIYLHNISAPRPSLLKTLSLPSILSSPAPTSSNLTTVSDEVRDLITMHPFLVETGPHASFAAHWSADGTKFGVASQSGVVGIWDVRSDKPLWSYQTAFRLDGNNGSGGGNGGNEPASNTTSRTPVSASLTSSFIDSFLSNDISFDRDFSLGAGGGFLSRLYEQWRAGGMARVKHAPPYGVRCLKFGRGAASDLVAFTEHTRRVHILDIRRFECHQVLEIPDGPPQGQIQLDTIGSTEQTGNAAAAASSSNTPDRNPRPRPRRRSAILVDPRSGGINRTPSPSGPWTNRALGNMRARLSANLAEEFGLTLGSGTESMEQLPDGPSTQQASISTASAMEPEVHMEDVSVSLTDVGDGVLHISSHAGTESDDDIEREIAEVGSSTLTPPGRVVWRTIGTRASSPQPRVTSIVPESTSGLRRVPGTRSHGVFINRSASISQVNQGQGYTSNSGNDTPTLSAPAAARPARRTHVRSTSSTTTLTPETEDTGDIAGLTWSASGESLFIATTKAIIEWRISDFGRARYELGAGGDEWCEEGEEMGGQELVWR